jgi:hypothetical protein
MTQFRLQGLRDWMRGGRAYLFVSLLLAAFVLQIASTRSHFHLGAASGVANAASPTDGPTKVPSGHDETKCRIWHASGVCGGAVPSVGAVLFVVKPVPARAVMADHAGFVPRIALAWRSRAPPLV